MTTSFTDLGVSARVIERERLALAVFIEHLGKRFSLVAVQSVARQVSQTQGRNCADGKRRIA